MENRAMRIDEFERALDRYGGDVAKWPDGPRAEAEALMASNADAAAHAARAARLDGLLSETVRPTPVDAALIGKIVAGLDNGARPGVMLHPTPRLAAWAGAAMIAFLSAGYAAGLMLPASQGEDTFAGLMFGSGFATDSETADAGSVL
jgi:hypothetical protein